MRTHLRFPALALAVGLFATACGSDGDAAPDPTTSSADDAATGDAGSGTGGTSQAEIVNFLYEPETLEVAVGATVVWTNQDRFGHTVTAGGPGAETGEFDLILGETTDKDTTGLMAEHTFTEAGTFEYYCRYHPSMVGTVVVG